MICPMCMSLPSTASSGRGALPTRTSIRRSASRWSITSTNAGRSVHVTMLVLRKSFITKERAGAAASVAWRRRGWPRERGQLGLRPPPGELPVHTNTATARPVLVARSQLRTKQLLRPCPDSVMLWSQVKPHASSSNARTPNAVTCFRNLFALSVSTWHKNHTVTSEQRSPSL